MVLAVLGARFQGALRARPAVGTWTNRICGTVLCAFGVGLALQRTQ